MTVSHVTYQRPSAPEPPPSRLGARPSPAPSSPERIREIDVVKGLAIIGVIMQHAFTPRLLEQTWDTLWAGQAVPVFFVVMGLNASRSMRRLPLVSLRAMYGGRYFQRRFERLVAPLLVGAAAGWNRRDGLRRISVPPVPGTGSVGAGPDHRRGRYPTHPQRQGR